MTREKGMDGSGERETEGPEVSVIGVGIMVNGNIEATVDLQIQGKVTGDVRCATLLLGDGSEIRGNIVAERVRVAGLVKGSIETKDLAVEAQGKVEGDVTYSRIRVANGAMVHGQMKYEPSQDGGRDEAPLRLVEQQAPAPKAAAVYIE
jgi:cytoskeletal protein CcmA (bactofilin family)